MATGSVGQFLVIGLRAHFFCATCADTLRRQRVEEVRRSSSSCERFLVRIKT